MIALNEIIKNENHFSNRYKLMGKKCNLAKIIKLEKKFISIEQQKNESRAICNKLCAQVAELVNAKKPTHDMIQQINKLDKSCLIYEKKSKDAMSKINRMLKKLPNLPLDENILNISFKTNKNPSFSAQSLKDEICKITEPILIKHSSKQYLKSLKNQVIKLESLPKCLFLKTKNNSLEIILLLGNNAYSVFENILLTLKQNAVIVIDKSIKKLSKISSKEIIARLCDDTFASIQFIGEYVSRALSLKFYDKKTDMTKFVNMIKIKIKSHG